MPAAIRDADEPPNPDRSGRGGAHPAPGKRAAHPPRRGPSDAARVSLVSRNGCTLCLEAERLVDDVCAARRVGWRRLDVDADPGLAHFTDHVPVLLIDDIVISYWFVDAADLGRRLDALAGNPGVAPPADDEGLGSR